MHCYPLVLVKAESEDEAVELAQNWLDAQDGECPYDYGSVVAGQTVRGGTEKFRETIKKTVETECRVLREHWDVAKAFLNSFEEPPVESERFKATYKVGYGLEPDILKAGEEISDELPACLGYWHARKLDQIREHMYGRDRAITSDAALYDARYSDDDCPPIEAGEDCWLVMLDCHS